MKKYFILCFLFLGSSNLFSQQATLEETQKWIQDKIELYPYSNLSDNSIWLSEKKFTVSFDDSNMIIYEESNNITLDVMEFRKIIIPLKNLMEITFEEKPGAYWLNFRIRNNLDEIKITQFPSIVKSKTYPGPKEINYVSKHLLVLSKSIDDNNLRPRLVKAFKYLVKLYGGKVVEEKF
tara:strand:+ start:174 stop:710 length:537 start_codon:yes stop_codon:yes gene_type:complete